MPVVEKPITVNVSPAAYDVIQGLRQLINTLRTPNQNLATIVAAVLTDLAAKVSELPAAGLEVSDLPAFIRGISNGVEDIAFDLLKPVVPTTK